MVTVRFEWSVVSGSVVRCRSVVRVSWVGGWAVVVRFEWGGVGGLGGIGSGSGNGNGNGAVNELEFQT